MRVRACARRSLLSRLSSCFLQNEKKGVRLQSAKNSTAVYQEKVLKAVERKRRKRDRAQQIVWVRSLWTFMWRLLKTVGIAPLRRRRQSIS